MVVSLKAGKTKLIAFLLLAAAVAGACFFLWKGGDGGEAAQISGETNEERVAFLESFGWEVDAEPAQAREVMIPAKFNDVYAAYNDMQKAQGFDLKPFAGEIVTQYQYKINNYPDQDEVYATLLVHAGVIVGGDVACAEVDGFMHGFAKDSARYGETGEKSPAPSSSPKAGEEPAAESPEDSSQESEPAEESDDSAQETAALPEEAYPSD